MKSPRPRENRWSSAPSDQRQIALELLRHQALKITALAAAIIGSGWLFSSFYAVNIAAPAAVLSWITGTAELMILAVAHAGPGGVVPVARGTARCPRLACGWLAGVSSGRLAWRLA